MLTFVFTILSLGILTILLAVEKLLIRKTWENVPLRILINGTRGKTQVTRLVHDVLRYLHFKPLGKISGTVPLWLLPDGNHKRIQRTGPANVYETITALFKARKLKCDSLVVECMAITPELEETIRKIVNPQITVVTNAFVDHPELGKTEVETLKSLLRSVPDDSICILPEHLALPEEMRLSLSKRGIKVKQAKISKILILHASRLGVFAENLALAFEVVNSMGILEEQLLHILEIIPAMEHDVGHFEYLELSNGAILASAFAANDLASTEKLLKKTIEDHPGRRLVGFINLRPDRPFRTLQMIELMERYSFCEIFSYRWCHRAVLKVHPNVKTVRSIEKITTLTTSSDIIFGFGNIKGLEDWIERTRSKKQKKVVNI
ncbi:MAG: gamma-polyglutamate synthase [Thermotogota bacterium]|nr:gamma-polyglutamate synthase [Thermotogota bacterium]MDK2864437.1 gamma-polyglutamate synthase [Thermotogota bacterium]